MNTIIIVIAFVFTVVWGLGFVHREEYKTHTNLRIIVYWIISLAFVLYHDVPGIHLIYIFPLAVTLSFLCIKFGVRRDLSGVLIVSAIIWSFILMAISDFFGTF